MGSELEKGGDTMDNILSCVKLVVSDYEASWDDEEDDLEYSDWEDDDHWGQWEDEEQDDFYVPDDED